MYLRGNAEQADRRMSLKFRKVTGAETMNLGVINEFRGYKF